MQPEDEIVKKYRYSGFLPGTSDLADRLRARGFDTRADHRHGDQCVLRKLGARRQHAEFPHDHGQRRQRGADARRSTSVADRLLHTFGDVMDTDMLVAALERGAAAKAA